MKFRLAGLTGLAIAMAATPALAGGVLSTRLLWPSSTQAVVCVVTNIGTAPAVVSVKGIGFSGAAVPASATTCFVDPTTLDPGESCHIAFAQGTIAWCSFTGKGKYRAVGQIRDATGEVQVVEATKK